MKQLIFAFKAYQKALKFSNDNNLWVYYLIPALCNLLIFSTLSYGFYVFGNYMIEWVTALLPQEKIEGFWLTLINFFVKALVYVTLFLVYLKTYRYVVLILLSPALAMLAEKVQEISQNLPSRPFNPRHLMADVVRGIRISLRNMTIEISLTILLSVIGLLLGFLSPFTTIAIILIESYFLGFSMIDYRNEFMRIDAEDSQKIIWKHKGFATGIGFVCTLLLFIPILGVLFAPLLAVVAAGLGINELENRSI